MGKTKATFRVKLKEPGVCPHCKKEGDLDYQDSWIDGETLSYKFTCNACGTSGYEVYKVEYLQTEWRNPN